MNDYFKRVCSETPTRFWINNVTREQAKLAIDAGAVGCTQNPSYVWKMLDGSSDSELAESTIHKYLDSEPDDEEVLINVQRELVSNIAKDFMPIYEYSHGKLGYVSIQGSPVNESAENIIRCAIKNCEAGPNIMAKIPVTEEGIKAIRYLIKQRIPINATECMAVRQVIDVCETYSELTKDLKDPAPIYFSLITGIFDQYCKQFCSDNDIDISKDALWHAGMIIARKVDSIIRERNYAVGFIGGGARGLHHFTEMVGANANVTINWKGTADKLIELDQPVSQNFWKPMPYLIEDELVEKLDVFRKAYFLHAIKPEEYEDFGPVVLFRSGFVSNWQKAIKKIGEMRKS